MQSPLRLSGCICIQTTLHGMQISSSSVQIDTFTDTSATLQTCTDAAPIIVLGLLRYICKMLAIPHTSFAVYSVHRLRWFMSLQRNCRCWHFHHLVNVAVQRKTMKSYEDRHSISITLDVQFFDAQQEWMSGTISEWKLKFTNAQSTNTVMQGHAMHVSLLSLLWETQQRTSAESEHNFSMQQFG